MSLANQIVAEAEPRSHYVQFYKADEPSLNRNVGYYIWEGLLRGDGLIVVATQQRWRGLTDNLERLGVDTVQTRNEGQLIFRDATEMLSRFMVHGQPDQTRFERVIDGELRRVHPPAARGSIRVYGEMVGVLWERDCFDAAICLEEYWNRVLHVSGITLFCGYPIDVFQDDLHNARTQAVLCNHTHLMPAGEDGDLEIAVQRAMQEVLGPEADELELAISVDKARHNPRLPPAEGTVVWLRENLPARAEDILSRARGHYVQRLQGYAA